MTTANIQVVKKPFWDADFALMEAEGVEKIFTLHLKRCDSIESAESLSKIFLSLGQRFEQKKIDLAKKIA